MGSFPSGRIRRFCVPLVCLTPSLELPAGGSGPRGCRRGCCCAGPALPRPRAATVLVARQFAEGTSGSGRAWEQRPLGCPGGRGRAPVHLREETAWPPQSSGHDGWKPSSAGGGSAGLHMQMLLRSPVPRHQALSPCSTSVSVSHWGGSAGPRWPQTFSLHLLELILLELRTDSPGHRRGLTHGVPRGRIPELSAIRSQALGDQPGALGAQRGGGCAAAEGAPRPGAKPGAAAAGRGGGPLGSRRMPGRRHTCRPKTISGPRTHGVHVAGLRARLCAEAPWRGSRRPRHACGPEPRSAVTAGQPRSPCGPGPPPACPPPSSPAGAPPRGSSRAHKP